jgi:hypothetical protein
MTTAECMNEWLNPVKAEPDNEARKEELLKFSLALLETMQKDLAMTANGVRKGSPFGPPQESALIVCFVWLGMPEMCQEVLKFTHCPSLGYLWRDLRVPVLRSGGIMRYRSFLTEALTDTEDFAQYVMHYLRSLALQMPSLAFQRRSNLIRMNFLGASR